MAHDLTACGAFFVKKRSQKILPGEDLTPQHRLLLADLAKDLPKKSRTGTERRIQWWKLHQSKENISKRRYRRLDFHISMGRSSRPGATPQKSSYDVQRKR
ncbi:hypothetical protein V3C99_011200 [Haemonchus contortus]